jgi:exonuclease SbcC
VIHFDRLYFEGAGPHSKCEIPLSDQGVVAILGKNGSGKSTITNVLKQILFGDAKDSIINRHNPELGFYGELEFLLGETKYHIEQARKHPRRGSGMFIYEDGHDVTRKNLPQAQKQVQEILGLSREEFGNCICLSDLQSSTLLYGTPGQRDSYLSSLFGLDICDLALDEVKDEHKKVVQLLEGRQRDIFTFESLQEKLTRLGKDKPDARTAATVKKMLLTREGELASLQKKHKVWVEIAAKFKQRKGLEEKLEALGDVVEPSETEIQELEKKLRGAEKSRAVRAQRRGIAKKLKSLPKPEADLSSLEKKLKRAESKLSVKSSELELVAKRETIEREMKGIGDAQVDPDSVKKELDESMESVVKCEVEIEALSKRYKVLSKEEESKCPTCGHEIEDKDKVLEEIEERKSKIKHRHHRYSSRITELRRLRDVADRLAAYKQKLSGLPQGSSKEIEEEISSYSTLVSSLKEQVRAADLRSELERQLQELPRVEDDIDPDEVSAKLDKLRRAERRWKEAASIKSILSSLPKKAPEEKHLQRLETEIEKAQGAITSLNLQRQELKQKLKEWEEIHAEATRLESAIAKAKKWKIEEAALTGLKSAFGRNGLRQVALRRVLKSITAAIPRYVTLLFQERSLSVKMAEDTFDFTIWRAKVEILKAMLSKGEKARLALALLLATRQAVPVKKRSNILIVDEILDGLDMQGVPSVLSAFDYLRKEERVGSIFMISPMSEIFEKKELSSRLDQKWLVTKEKNSASLEMRDARAR